MLDLVLMFEVDLFFFLVHQFLRMTIGKIMNDSAWLTVHVMDTDELGLPSRKIFLSEHYLKLSFKNVYYL